MTDTPIYDQLRLELSSPRPVQSQPPDVPPRPRARAEKPPTARRIADDANNRQPVSVWTLVNANRRAKP